MPKLTAALFRTADSQLTDFLCTNYGLQRQPDGRTIKQTVSADVATAIEIEQVAGCTETLQNAAYWKLGFCMRDVSRHASLLRSRDVSVSAEAQFKDIGFVAHTHDSDENVIELLQHRFESNVAVFADTANAAAVSADTADDPAATVSTATANDAAAENNPATLGQITIRTSNIDDTLAFYTRIGMKLLAVMPVPDYNFSLYFLTYTDDDDESPPNAADLEAVENREWLWQRPFCTVEIQHVRSRQIEKYVDLAEGQRGFAGMRVTVSSKDEAQRLFKTRASCVVRDPNNIPIHVDIVD